MLSLFYSRAHQRGARGHQVARKDHVSRPRACSKNNISMINAFTLMNINTEKNWRSIEQNLYFMSSYQNSCPSH